MAQSIFGLTPSRRAGTSLIAPHETGPLGASRTMDVVLGLRGDAVKLCGVSGHQKKVGNKQRQGLAMQGEEKGGGRSVFVQFDVDNARFIVRCPSGASVPRRASVCGFHGRLAQVLVPARTNLGIETLALFPRLRRLRRVALGSASLS